MNGQRAREAEPGAMWISIECLCDPPRTLTADPETPVARCEKCGVEVLVGGLSDKPRLELVRSG